MFRSRKVLPITMAAMLFLVSGWHSAAGAANTVQAGTASGGVPPGVSQGRQPVPQVSSDVQKMRERARLSAEEIRQNQQALRGQAAVAASVYREQAAAAKLQREQAGATTKAKREQVRLRAEQVRQNHQVIKDLQEANREKASLAREAVKQMREAPDLVPPEKAAATREKLELFRKSNASLAEEMRQIRPVRDNADGAIAAQEARIRILQQKSANLDELLALLR